MNDKQKQYMEKQELKIVSDLSSTFNIPVFQDEISENEIINNSNFLLVVYGDYRSTETAGYVIQEIYVVFVSENNPNVEMITLDIISTISKVNGIDFDRSVKERIKKNDTDSYLDQVTLVFKRKIKYEY